jgi:hypothetical protein
VLPNNAFFQKEICGQMLKKTCQIARKSIKKLRKNSYFGKTESKKVVKKLKKQMCQKHHSKCTKIKGFFRKIVTNITGFSVFFEERQEFIPVCWKVAGESAEEKVRIRQHATPHYAGHGVTPCRALEAAERRGFLP